MPKVWDNLMKLLAKANPQHLVSLLLPGATFVNEAFNELEVQSKEIQADIMYNVVWYGQETILHIEFQRRHDEDMGQRVWKYNALATILKQRVVCSFVIYLIKDHGIVQPPYRQFLPNDELLREFHYKNIYLWDVPASALKQPGLEGLLPLLPLARDGARRAVVNEVITDLQTAEKEDLLPLAYAFAALILEKSDDRQWLQRRFDMLHDILEESWAYQEMFQRATEKGLQRGRDEALLEERLRELQQQRRTLATYVELHFPALVPLLKRQIEATDDLETLQRLLIHLFMVRDEQEAERTILSAADPRE